MRSHGHGGFRRLYETNVYRVYAGQGSDVSPAADTGRVDGGLPVRSAGTVARRYGGAADADGRPAGRSPGGAARRRHRKTGRPVRRGARVFILGRLFYAARLPGKAAGKTLRGAARVLPPDAQSRTTAPPPPTPHTLPSPAAA